MDTCCSVIHLLSIALFLGQVHGWSISDEENLRSALLTNYTSTVRPHDTVHVGISLVPLSLNTLDIGEQFMSMTFIFLTSWTDPRLMWTPSSYGNINELSLSVESVWSPVFIIENAVNNVGRIGGKQKDGTLLRVDSSGSITWFPPIEASTFCEMKISHFPFDKQDCSIFLTAWSLPVGEIQIASREVRLNYYAENGEWEFRNWSVTEDTFYDESRYFTRLSFNFSFRRNWPFYGQNLLMPILLSSLLIAFVFLVPIESGEKLSYALTVLLSYVVFLTWVTDILPSTSNEVSVLQVYLAIILCLGVLATLLTCWILVLYHREPTQPISRPMRCFVTRVLIPLRNFACGSGCQGRGDRDKVQPCDHTLPRCSPNFQHTVPEDNNGNSQIPFGAPQSAVSKYVNRGSSLMTEVRKAQPNTHVRRAAASKGEVSVTSRSKELSKVSIDDTKSVNQGDCWHNSALDHKHQEKSKEERSSWQEVAAMFDYFFFIVFLTVMSVLSSIILGILYVNYY